MGTIARNNILMHHFWKSIIIRQGGIDEYDCGAVSRPAKYRTNGP